jgi:hypothetical protein
MSKLSLFIKNQMSFFWLPAAWICGVRVDLEESNKCVVRVKLGFINKNPFKSLFWAVQGMAAEMPGGLLLQNKIKSSGQNIAMLLVGSSSKFTKKAVGKITFTCKDGHLIDEALKKTIATGEGQTFWMQSVGLNEDGIVVSTFNFEWSIKVKS